MVPKFEAFFLPCLIHLSDGKIHTQDDIRKYVIAYFNLSQEDQNALIRSGKKTMVSDRVSWTISYFQKARLIDTPKRGNYIISQRGKDFLKNHSKGFCKNDLMVFEEFTDFVSKKSDVIDSQRQNLQIQDHDEITPTDYIEEVYRQINTTLADELITKVLEMSPAFFEKLVVELLVKMGYGGSFEDAASVTQYTKDEGIDGVIKEDKLGLDTIYIQAKRWDKGTIGRKEIQAFVGALDGKNANKGVFITTSTFSTEAQTYVRQIKSKVVLIDGAQLCKYMIEYNLGVSVRQIYEIKKIDQDYFEE